MGPRCCRRGCEGRFTARYNEAMGWVSLASQDGLSYKAIGQETVGVMKRAAVTQKPQGTVLRRSVGANFGGE